MRVLLLKFFKATKNFWLYKVKNWPELRKIVLEWRSCEYDTMTFDSQTCDISPELSVFVLGFVSFINSNDIIFHIGQVHPLSADHCVTGQKNTSLFTQFLHLFIPVIFLLVIKRDHIWTGWTPLLEFLFPVGLHCGWHNNQDFLDEFILEQTLEIHWDLDCLSQSHVISEHSTFILSPEIVQPLDTLFLVVK